MIDEIYDRGYQDGRSALNEAIDRLVQRVASAIPGRRSRNAPPAHRPVANERAGLA